ncbi:MAG: hypothetical protein R2784_14335 [Saprospiraceae bacterium]
MGRIRTFYIRADMNDPETAMLAELQMHNHSSQYSTRRNLRGAAGELGIKAITLEVGDPNRFQKP